MLFLQGSRDTFATAALLEDVVARIGPTAVLQWVDGGDHSFAVAGAKRPADQVWCLGGGAGGGFHPVRGWITQQ